MDEPIVSELVMNEPIYEFLPSCGGSFVCYPSKEEVKEVEEIKEEKEEE